jgi:hypothetical protein
VYALKAGRESLAGYDSGEVSRTGGMDGDGDHGGVRLDGAAVTVVVLAADRYGSDGVVTREMCRGRSERRIEMQVQLMTMGSSERDKADGGQATGTRRMLGGVAYGLGWVGE